MSLVIDYGIKAWKKAGGTAVTGVEFTNAPTSTVAMHESFEFTWKVLPESALNKNATLTFADGTTHQCIVDNTLNIYSGNIFENTDVGGGTYYEGFTDEPITVVIKTEDGGFTDSCTFNFKLGYGYYGDCFLNGTQISLVDGSTKNAEDITYDDELLVWNFDEGKFDTAKPVWIKKTQRGDRYLESTYSDGTILETVGRMPSAHRIFNKELGRFTSLGKDETPIGTTTFNSLGEEVTLTKIEFKTKDMTFHDIMTDKHINLFANGILTSSRLSNLYTIKDMKYIKDSRTLNKNFGILEDLFKGLRIAEQPIDLKAGNFDTTIEQYIKHMMYRQKEKE